MTRSTTLVVVLVAAISVAVFAPAAAADPPVVVTKTSSLTSVLTGACPFSITVDSTMTETDKFFSDQNGVLIRASAHVDEQDSFGANGKSLAGAPYTVNLQAFFDSSGNITEEYANGVIERVPLPDGSVFQSTGRVDFGAEGFPAFAVVSDYGSARNLDGFCAALSP
jgi:flagellar hook assembly protein FlgD